MVKVLYVGDASGFIKWYFQSPFLIDFKEFGTVNVGLPLIKALEAGGIEVEHMPTWVAYERFPKTAEEMKAYDVIILSDVEAEVLLFYPEFFLPHTWRGVVKGPNRVKELVKYVKQGGGLLFMGSWVSFVGRYGRGLWWRTALAEALPVECLTGTPDDRVECPEGTKIKVLRPDHPIMRGIPWETFPPLLGYNETKAKEGAEVLATVSPEDEERDDPLIVVWEYGDGRVMVFTSDPVPHWGINLIRWEHYPRFWQQAVRWLARLI